MNLLHPDRFCKDVLFAKYCVLCPRYEIFIRLHGEDLVECPYHLYIAPGDLSAKQSIIFYDEVLNSVAGRPTSFEVQARDAYCNHITTGGDTFEGVMRQTTTRKAVPLTFIDNQNGTYSGNAHMLCQFI